MPRRTACLFAVLFFIGCRSNAVQQVSQAPDFSLKDLSGRTITLDAYQNHPVMIDFWATWCGPCQLSIPRVQRFYMKHKDEGLVVLGLNMDDDPSPVLPFVKRFGITYPVLLAGQSSAAEDYRVDGFPTFIFIDAQGRIVQDFEGFSPDMPDAWEAEYQRLASNH